MTELRANRWQLPDGVNELFPADAWRVETLRRQIMDTAYHWGYELVMPPLIEYLESLLTGTGERLDLETFKIIDQQTGRTMGIRADMTPQVARMDSHALRRAVPNRFFYIGSVLKARTDGAGSSRTPQQFGAELFGHAGPESDAEIIQLMLDNIMMAGLTLNDVILDVGHVGVYRALAEDAHLPDALQRQVFDSLTRGSRPEVIGMLQAHGDNSAIRAFSQHIDVLMQLCGDRHEVLRDARDRLSSAGDKVHLALDNLQAVLDRVTGFCGDINIHIDLAELRGYSYHTGIVFKLYDLAGAELSRGGRYDAIGEAFGQARPATGFSGDLIRLASVHRPITKHQSDTPTGIWVGCDIQEQVIGEVRSLRAAGERVVMSLPGSLLDAQTSQCNRQLVLKNGKPTVVDL